MKRFCGLVMLTSFLFGSCAFSDQIRMPIEYYEDGNQKTDTFYRIGYASKVDLSNGKYDPITDTISYGSIDTFILSNNSIKDLPPSFFYRNEFIGKLDLSRNSFNKFFYVHEGNLFSQIGFLDLSHNKITDTGINFESLDLKTLDLSHNQLKSFESGELRLKYLFLSNNPLEHVFIENTEYVEIHNAGKESSVFSFDDVKRVYLNNLNASMVSFGFSEMDTIRINNCVIREVNFEYSEVSYADLSGTPIEEIYGDLPKKINLAGSLKGFKGELGSLFEFQKVEELNMAENDIKDFSFIEYMDVLQKLNASVNNIEDLTFFEDEYHSPNQKLIELDLSKNKIRDISPLQDFPKLQVLNLAENRIKSLTHLLYNPDLRKLDLSFNILAEVPDDIRFLKKLKWLNLTGNPLSNENIEHLRKLMPKTTIVFDTGAKRSFEDKGDITVFMKGLPKNEFVTISLQDENHLILGLSNGQVFLYDKIAEAFRLLASFSDVESILDMKWIGKNELVLQTQFSGTHVFDLDDFSMRLITEWPGEKISVFRKNDGFLLYYGGKVAGFGKFIGDELGEFSYEKDINHLSTSLKRTTVLFMENEVWWMLPGKDENWEQLKGIGQQDAVFLQLEGAIILSRSDSAFIFYEDQPLVYDELPLSVGVVIAAAKEGDIFYLLNDQGELFQWNKATGATKIQTKENLKTDETFRDGISLFAVKGVIHFFNSNGNTLYSIPSDTSGISKSWVLPEEKGFDHFTLDAEGKRLFLFSDEEISVLHLNSGSVRKESHFTPQKITEENYRYPEYSIEFSDRTGKYKHVFDESSLTYSLKKSKDNADQSKLRVKRVSNQLMIYSRDGKKEIGLVRIYDAPNFNYILSGDSLLITTQEFKVEIHRLGDTTVTKEVYALTDDALLTTPYTSRFHLMERHGDFVFVFWSNFLPFIYDIRQQKEIRMKETNFSLFPSAARTLAVSGDTIAISGLLGNARIFAFHEDYFEYVSTIELKDDQSTKRIALDARRNLLYVMSADKNIDIYRYEKYESEYLMSVIYDSEGIQIIDNEMNYLGKPAGAEGLKFSYAGKVYSLESFSQLFNQPSKILRELGYADEKFLATLDRLREKKVKKVGKFTMETLNTLPEVDLKSSITGGICFFDTLAVLFNAKTQKDTMDYAVIYQNGVPVKKTYINAPLFSGRETITLVPGSNVIGVQVVSKSGVKSLIEELQVECKIKTAKPDLYFLGIGADQFTESAFNLEFPAKDVMDFAGSLRNDTAYNDSHLKLLTGKDVTVQKVKEALEQLQKTKKNDVVIIYFAGHGVFDGDLDYYLAMHDMSFTDPKSAGLPYDTLAAWMNKVTSIRRILFMDACHSGELDKEEYKLIVEQETKTSARGVVKFRNSGTVVQSDKPQEALEMAREYFSTFGLSSGWNIIGSSSGAEYSMETAELKNGLFTYYLIQDRPDADLNSDGKIDLEEWMTLVTKDVRDASEGKQSPQFRERNRRSVFRF